jgi:cytoskeletal protein CcmA (bactofilin family)
MLGKQPVGEGRIDTILGEACRFRGDVQVDGGIRIDGDFEGTLRATESVVVGKTGSVRADINSDVITVGGKVYGNITGKRKVLLESGAHVEGDVTTVSLVINEGVFFQGGCRMGDGSGAGVGAATATNARWNQDLGETTPPARGGERDREPEAKEAKSGLSLSLKGLGRS